LNQAKYIKLIRPIVGINQRIEFMPFMITRDHDD